MRIFRVFRYSEVLGGPRNRPLSYYKSVGIRHFFGNIEGGPLSGGAPPPYTREKAKIRLPPPYTREKVKIRLLRGRSDFDVPKNRQNPQKMKKTRSESAESDFDVAKTPISTIILSILPVHEYDPSCSQDHRAAATAEVAVEEERYGFLGFGRLFDIKSLA